jgi:CYTH domain-containing protein
MEIEKKYIVKDIPMDISLYPSKNMEQGYISTAPVIRVRKSNDSYVLTIKSKGLMSRQEHEIGIDQEAYDRLLKKIDGSVVSKTRYVIPLTDTEGTTGNADIDKNLKIELDIFTGSYEGLIYAEVEFPSEEAAMSFVPPEWFYKDVTMDGAYHNSALSGMNDKEAKEFMVKVKKL